MAVIGSAQVLVRPTFKGLQKQVAQEMGDVGQAAGKRGGSTIGASLKKWGGRAAKAGGVAIAAAVGTSLVTGFKRLTALEDAEAMLRGLGYSAEEVGSVMDTVAAATEGTAIRLDAAASTAAQMIAAGIQPGKELEETLRLVADAATIAGGDMDGMTAIFGKVAASNRLSMQEVNQLLDRSIPILQMVADHFGITQDAAREMVTAGQVDFDIFAEAMETQVGGAALEAGETTRGALENLGAYIARAGARLLGPLMDPFREAVNSISEWLKGLEPTLQAFGEAVGEWVGRAAETIGTFIGEMRDGEGAGGRFAEILTTIKDAVVAVVEWVNDHIVPAFQSFAESVGGALADRLSMLWGHLSDLGDWFSDNQGTIGDTADVIGEILGAAIEKAGDAIAWLIDKGAELEDWILSNKTLVQTLVGAYVAWRATMAGISFVTLIAGLASSAAAWGRETVATISNTAAKVASKIETIAIAALLTGSFLMGIIRTTTAWIANTAAVVAQRAAVVAQRVAMVAGAVATNTMAVAQRALNLVMRMNPIGLVVTALTLLVGALIAAYQKSETFRNIVDAAWNGIKTAVGTVWDWMKGVFESLTGWLEDIGGWFTGLRDTAGDAWESLKEKMLSAWNTIKDAVMAPFETAFEALQTAGEAMSNALADAWTWLKDKFRSVWGLIDKLVFAPFREAFSLLKAVFTGDTDEIKRRFSNMKDNMQRIGNRISSAVFGPFKTAFKAVKDFFGNRVDDIKGYWNSLKSNLKAGYDWIKSKVVTPFSNSFSWLGDKVRDAKNRIGRIWDDVKGKFASPINWVIDKVWNNGIKRVFQAVVDVIPGLNVTVPRVSRIPARAKGGYTPPGWTLVGEEGPELVNFSAPSRVYTADETRAMMAGQRPNPAQQFSESNPAHGGFWDRVGSGIAGGARWLADGVRDAAGNVLKWARGGLARAAEAVLNPIRNLMTGSTGNGLFGRLLSGASGWGFDSMIEWLRGEDEKGVGGEDSQGRTLRGALSHVNAAAFAIADAIQPGMFMQAFNQSMHSTHAQGRAVDFMASGGNLQRVADYMVANASMLNGIVEVIYNWRRWTPAAGWHALRGGYGNDPGHTWHVHGTWPSSYDDGGWLLPGQAGMNYSKRPEPVFSSSQWDVLKGNLGRGFPERVKLVVGDREFDAYVGDISDGRIESAASGLRRHSRQRVG